MRNTNLLSDLLKTGLAGITLISVEHWWQFFLHIVLRCLANHNNGKFMDILKCILWDFDKKSGCFFILLSICLETWTTWLCGRTDNFGFFFVSDEWCFHKRGSFLFSQIKTLKIAEFECNKNNFMRMKSQTGSTISQIFHIVESIFTKLQCSNCFCPVFQGCKESA